MERNQEKDKETYKEIYQNRRNPILPPRYHIPDVEAHVMPDGMLYLYGSYDNQEDAYCSEEYHVVSTPDMEHWTVHETALEGSRIPWFGDPDAPKYPGVDWSHPTPFIRKLFAGRGFFRDGASGAGAVRGKVDQSGAGQHAGSWLGTKSAVS